MGLLASNRSRIIGSFVLTTLVGAVGIALWLPNGPFGDGLTAASYDSLHRLSGETVLEPSPVVIVYLDRPSYDSLRLDPKETWPRELHGQLVDRLTAAGARAVVFDILFAEPGTNAAADQLFAQALQRNGRVALAAEYIAKATHKTGENQDWVRLHTLTPPAPLFASAAATWGIVAQRIDPDFTIRNYVAGLSQENQSTLTWATARWLKLPIQATPLSAANDHYIRYYGPPTKIPHTSYYQALATGGVPDDFFKDKIVFVGARPMVESFHSRQDEFRNPFESWGYKDLFMPGVEVHATEMLNLLRADWLRRLPAGAELLLLLASAALFGGGLVWLRPIPAAVTALGGGVVVMLLAGYGFGRNVWFPWLIVSAAQMPTALGGSVLFYSIGWYRTRRLLEAGKRVADAKIREQAALLDKAHDAILVQDLNGRILYANPSAERLYGGNLAELQQDGAARDLFSGDEDAATAARATALAKGEWNGELHLQTRSGQRLTMDTRWTLIRDESGRPNALLLINSDITEKKNLEAQFLRTQRMNTIGSLAGGMAHDLNNALAPILLGVQLLRRKSRDEESRELLSLMETNTHRSADMVRQVLLFARGRGGEFESLEMGPLIGELEKMVRETFPKNISVEAFLPGDLWRVRGNPTQLHQVLLNLCVNARDAMPNGGRLSFAADNVDLSAAEAAAISEGKPGQYVSVLVSDTGGGMQPEVRARIFEPFFTTKEVGRGTGIGLATVLRIVKGHGGFLRLESEPEHGTAFEIFLPRATEVAAPEAAEAPPQIPRGQGELILVADDEHAIRNLVSEGLTSHGYRVVSAATGEEALQLFHKYRNEVRLLFTDSAMPVMDGPRAIAEIRKKSPSLPIILASGQRQLENGESSRGVLLLSKPFSLDEVLLSVHRFLPSPGQAKAS